MQKAGTNVSLNRIPKEITSYRYELIAHREFNPNEKTRHPSVHWNDWLRRLAHTMPHQPVGRVHSEPVRLHRLNWLHHLHTYLLRTCNACEQARAVFQASSHHRQSNQVFSTP